MLLIILALAGYMAMLMFSGDPQAGTEPMELAAAGETAAAAPGAGATATAPGAEQTTALLDPATLDQLEAPVDEAPMFAPLTDAAPQAEPTRLRPLPQANEIGRAHV